MENIDQIKLINQIFSNSIIFQKQDDINDYNIILCEDYNNLNLYVCQKEINTEPKKFIKQLSKDNIRTTLFNNYFKIEKLTNINENKWTEKIIYNDENYNIQTFISTKNSLLCYSDLDLDDDSFEYIWINNPFTKIEIIDNILYLKIAFEISNSHQKEIVEKFLNCLDKLIIALKS